MECLRPKKKNRCVYGLPTDPVLYRDGNSQPFSIRKICWLTPKWRKSDFSITLKALNNKISIETSQFMLILYLNLSFNFIQI